MFEDKISCCALVLKHNTCMTTRFGYSDCIIVIEEEEFLTANHKEKSSDISLHTLNFKCKDHT